MINKPRHKIALAIATLGAAAGIGVVLTPLLPQVDANLDKDVLSEMGMIPEMPIPPVIHYGAIAYSPTGASGKSWGHPTKQRAQQAALEKCGLESCEVLTTFNLCGAVAYNGANYHGGSGYSRRMAEEDAMNNLGGGWIVNWVCH